MSMPYPPRIMRPPEAIYYCGLGRTVFEKQIRPLLQSIPVGDRGVGFDRLDLDDAVSQYKELHSQTGNDSWRGSPALNGTKRPAKAESESSSEEKAFRDASMQAQGKKLKRSTIR